MIRSAAELVEDYSERVFADVEWQNTWAAIASMLVPHESEIVSKGTSGARQTSAIYDSTGIDALDKLTSAIMGTMFSSVVPPFVLTPRVTELKTDPETLDWTEVVSTRMFDTVNASNFERVAPGMINSTAAYGTGALGAIEVTPQQAPEVSGFRGLHHLSLPIGTYVIDEDPWGMVELLTRTYWMSARALLKRWPTADYSRAQRDKLKGEPHRLVQVFHGVHPNGSRRGLKWDEWYVLGGIDQPVMPTLPPVKGNDAIVLEQGGYREFPFFVPRWYQSPGEVWGRGRGHIAFPELRTANRARQLKLRAWAKTIDPPLKVLNRGVFGRVRLIPGAENVVRDMNAIEAMDFKIRFDHQAIPEQESKLQIRQMFYTEQLLQFAVDRKTPPTATEVLQRMDFLHQLLGPASGRLRVEAQTPYIKRVFNLMLRAGEFPDPPNALLASGGVLDIEFLGPLARAQHNDELRGLTDTVGVVSALSQLDPNAADNYDVDAMSRDLPRITGVSRRYLRTAEAVDVRRRERAEQQAALQRQQEAIALGQTAKDLGAANAADAQAAQVPA